MKVRNIPVPRRIERSFSYNVLAVIGLSWLVVFYILPILLLVYTSIDFGSADPFAVYRTALGGLYIDTIVKSFVYGLVVTVACIVLSFVTSYYIAMYGKYKKFLLALVIVPAWVAYIVRYIGIYLFFAGPTVDYLGSDLGMLFTTRGVLFAIIVVLLPFAILPTYASLSRVDKELMQAAQTSGASELRAIYDVAIPLSLPGIVAGSVIVFILASGTYIAPDILGGPAQTMIANMIGDAYSQLYRIELAAAIATVYTSMLILLIVVFNRYVNFEEALGNL